MKYPPRIRDLESTSRRVTNGFLEDGDEIKSLTQHNDVGSRKKVAFSLYLLH